jgi:hypothetical protein
MGEMIQKPDANPILLAALNFIVCGALGYWLMGQKKKAIYFGVAWVVGWVCLGWLGIGALIGFLVQLIGGYDAYLLGQKLAAGESIGENENGLSFLNSIIKD